MTHYGQTVKKLQLMGILNCTPDSFYDGGHYTSLEKAVQRGIEIEKEGADMIDIGAESSHPGAQRLPEEKELERLIPLIKELSPHLSIPISVDTYKPQVAEKALQAGAKMLNDISGFENKNMRALAKEYQVPLCLMHMQGCPQTMQLNPHYPSGVINELKAWFSERIELLLKEGILPQQIILDPGIGFGKSVTHILEILKNIKEFCAFGFPVLIGLSRKSFMSKILCKPSSELLSTTVALNTMSILEGASIIRVHDVKEHRDVMNTLALL